MKNKEKDLQKALKSNAKKLTVAGLQDAILTLYKENEGKKFSARHIIEKLEVGNNKDSVHYAVEQLVGNGKLPMDSVDNILSAHRGKDKSDRKGHKNKAKEIGDNLENVEKLAETAEEFADRVRKEKANFRQKREEKARKSDNRNQLDRPDNRQLGRGNDPSKRTAPRELKVNKEGNDERRKSRGGVFEGIVDVTKTGAGYVICEGQEQDIYVPQKFLNGAMKGDRVKISAYFPPGKRRPDGEVIKILQRSTDAFLGTFHFSKNNGYVQTDRIDVPEIYVKLEDAKGAEDGMKVVVQILDWNTERGKRMTGRITTVLGMAGSSDIEMKGILINNGFNIEFSDEVLAEAAKIHDDTEGDAKNRRDFRGITTFTIDPFDAKDFDDALSFQVLENGNIEIGVHIADVTHYIKPNTALDKEAYLRSTSVYLVDRVCPMLPERLSNELCSLRPNEDKLTFSAVFEFDDTYKIVKKWFGKTLIHSNRRYAYEEAQTILQSGEGDYADELLKLNQIAYALRKKRYKDGAINFETDEVKFKLDEAGVPIEVYIKERNDSHLLIEDFMLLANRSVAEFMAKRDDAPRRKGVEVPYIYRTHDTPNQDKLNDFGAFALELGVKMKLDTPKNIAKSLNDLAEKADKDETLRLLTPIAIRCMAKADYSTENIGHYGLAFEYYSHFTSPIRRYSDVLAHRILFDNLTNIKRYDKAELDEQCKHISKQEKKAADSERQSIKYKQVEYMTKHIGEVFEGAVSGMVERGVFVEIKHMLAEGMVDFGRCPEPFEVEPSRLRAKGLRTGKVLKMGQLVKVEIVDADMETRKIDMRLLEY
jgi:ribonuclease R